ncbi:MAG TPA: ABC transporter permease [Puia sp.]|uniref:ABC transporter permease n=1 Tax=Puia sp. TaxID=2045100 RepID=UPI002B5EE82F|nr:ABC transporter permease [Puia sp.]HVU94782.1 ABC transporter permease [Puia sp.]
MLKNSLTIAWRRLVKHRQFSLLNILGLSTGLACAILIYCWISDELDVDKYNHNDNRIAQVLLNSPSSDGQAITTADYTPGYLAATLAKEFPEVESSTAVVGNPWHDKKGVLRSGDHAIAINAVFLTNSFFDIFTLPIIAGNKRQVLQDKNDIVISTDLAKRLFGATENLIGKTLEWSPKDYAGIYRISGVFQKPPASATMQFDLAFNYSLFLDKNQKLLDWRNNDPATFVLLRPNANLADFNRKIAGLVKNKNAEAKSTLFAQRYSDRYLHGVYENGRPQGGRIEYVRLFSLIAIFIGIIAAINFMNLSTAKAAGRIKEAGIKKVIGARRSALIGQYLAESLLLTAFAVLIALGLAALALPQFDHITGKQLHLRFDIPFIVTLLAITLVTGIGAGAWPALYCSGFKPIAGLTGRLHNSIDELWVRKGLVVFQFTLSALFIIAVLVVHRQMHWVQTKNLGYDRSHLLYFHPAFETSLPDLIREVRRTPGVLDAANFGQNITNRDGGTTDISWPGKDPAANINFTDLSIGYGFIETAGIKLTAGRSFSREYGNEKTSVIFNQAAIDIMGIKDPIGKTIHLWGSDRRIIGVAENFHFQSFHETIKPCFFECNETAFASNIMVRIAPGAEQTAIQHLSELYKAGSGGLTLEYTFLEDDFQRLYAAETRVALLARYFAALAVIISGLGLFGLAAYTAQKRQKEIGIRKVIGASTGNLMTLLSRDFLALTGLALLIAFPAAAWLMGRWLHGFAYRVPLSADIFIFAAVTTLGITIASIGWQCARAASANPIRALRAE